MAGVVAISCCGLPLASLSDTDALITNNLFDGFQEGNGKLEQCCIVSHKNNGFSRAERGVHSKEHLQCGDKEVQRSSSHLPS